MQTRRGKSTRASWVGVRVPHARLMAAEALGPPNAGPTLLDSRSELTRLYVLDFWPLAIVLKAAVSKVKLIAAKSTLSFS